MIDQGKDQPQPPPHSGDHGADSNLTIMTMAPNIRRQILRAQFGPLLPPASDRIEIIPANNDVAVRFDPQDNHSMYYDPYNNEIVVGRACLGWSDIGILAGLRHERSHATFSALSDDDQIKLVQMFTKNHLHDLQTFFSALRQDPITYGTGTLEANELMFDYANKIGRGHKYIEKIMLWNGDRLEDINATHLVDELIAYTIYHRTRKEALPESFSKTSNIATLASGIMSKIHPDIHTLLDNRGFFNIEGMPLLEKLFADPLFAKAERPVITK